MAPVTPRGVPRALAAAFLALGVLSVVATVVVLEVFDPGLLVNSDTFSVFTGLLAAVVCATAAVVSSGPLRAAWAMFALFMTLYAVGDSLWLLYADAEGDVPVLSLADALYTMAFVPAALGLVLYPVVELRGRMWRVLLLDAAVIATAVLLLTYALVVHPIVTGDEGLLEKFMLSIYPVTDAMVTSFIVLLLLRSVGPQRCDVILIGVTWAIYTAADSGYAFLRLDEQNSLGTIVDVGYTVAPLVLSAAAAVAATVPTPRRVLRRHLPGTLAPILADLIALGSLAVAAAVGPRDVTTVVLVVATLMAVGGRRIAQRAAGEHLRRSLEARVESRTHELETLTQDYRRLDAMKYEFVTAVSHELRTPLAAIRGSLEMLHDGDAGDVPPTAMSVLAIASRGSERLTRLVDDIIDLERLESGTFGFSPAAHPVTTMVEEAVQSLQSLADERSVTIEMELADLVVRCDADRVAQVLVNLLGNALKFSPVGGTVTVGAGRQGDEALVRVTDEGRGIPAEELEAVFERFHQVEMDDARQQGGAGLGLTICRHIVERHGGRIWVESPGAGTTFRFTLPLTEA